jgi:hypothetical protein
LELVVEFVALRCIVEFVVELVPALLLLAMRLVEEVEFALE